MPTNPRFKALLRALPLNWNLASDAPLLDALIGALVTEIVETDVYARAASNRRGLRDATELLVINLLRLKYCAPGRLLALPMGKAAYAGRSVGYFHLRRAVAGLCAVRVLVMEAKGFRNRKTGKGFVARFRSLGRFDSLCTAHGISSTMIKIKEPDRLVELRKARVKTGKNGKKSKPIVVPWPQPFAAERARMVGNLRTINEALSSAFIALHVSDSELELIQDELERDKEESRYIDFFDKQLYRVFHDGNPKLGGRFYGGWWQNIPREYRKHIHIATYSGGWPSYSFELDYSAIQPRILYAKERCELTSDVYAIYDDSAKNAVSRETVKSLLLQMLNAASQKQALQAAQQELVKDFDKRWRWEHPSSKRPKMSVSEMLPTGCPPLKELMRDIEARHQPIRQYFYTDVGKQLMYEDSMIAERVMLRMLKAGSVALPIHDSFLVRKGYQWDLERYMQEEFHAATGAIAPVKADETEFEADNKANPRQESDGIDLNDLSEILNEDNQKRSKYSVYTTLRESWGF